MNDQWKEVVGEVLEADVRQRRFQIWTDPKTCVSVAFDESQEGIVTQALKDHRSVQIRVRGRADVSPQGEPTRFTEIESLELVPIGDLWFDPNAPRIEDEIAEIWSDVSPGQWSKLPSDLTDNLDHYIYGTPKE